ncbi:ATP-binding protein, partial [Longimicrobium sp.]|uniref:ATP-binding protein n=1 Tax=Longimicrobium sp. TaxID=2029185 RepID=UPI003B3A8A73
MSDAAHAADLRTLVEFNADGLLIVDGEGHVRFGNPAAARLFGRPLEELVGADLGLPLLDGDTAEMDVVPRGGAPATVELRARPVQWDGTGAYVVTLRDVTERRRSEEMERGRIRADAARDEAERATRRAEFLALASGVLNATLDVQTVLDQLAGLAVPTLAEFALVHWRGEQGEAAQTAAVHGHDAAQRILDALPPLDAEAGSAVARVLRTGRADWHPGGPVPQTTDPDPTGGALHALLPTAWMTVPLAVRGRVLGALTLCRTDPGARYVEVEVGLAEELARRGALAAENARLFRAAQAASRAKSHFLATVSHEIRTPINAVMGYAELLEMGLGGPLQDKQAEYVGRIQGSSRHLLSLVNDVLDLSKIEAGEMAVRSEALPLRATADRAMEQVEPQARAKSIGLALEWSCPEDDVYVGDEDRVSQVLVNLLSNAVKFTEPGGSVTVTCSAGALGPPTLLESDNRMWVTVEVADTGIGIPPDKLEAVFEPFMQVDAGHTRREGGTGLGLAISRRLSRLMGGELTVESAPGQGSRFILWLPTTGAAGDGAARAEASAWPAEPGTIPGLGELGRRLADGADAIIQRLAERLRMELEVPGIERMSRTQLEDHLATYLMDLAQMMVTLDEEGGDPSLLRDGEHIQRLLSWKHADQRLRLGWSAGQMRREHALLLEEVEAALRDDVLGDGEQARDVLRRLLADGEVVSLSR